MSQLKENSTPLTQRQLEREYAQALKDFGKLSKKHQADTRMGDAFYWKAITYGHALGYDGGVIDLDIEAAKLPAVKEVT